ncbi:MAG: phosphotransferase [Hyphomicrobiales bacterium]|nr:phosphotransferase [Hyphomicrobiales bacterium]
MTSVERVRGLPLWSGPVEPEPLKGGLSNESFTVVDGGEKFVVRFGHDFPVHHVFRDNEHMASAAAFEAGFAPEMVYAGEGEMVVRFIDGKTYDDSDVRTNLARIADLTRRFHNEMPKYVSGPGRLFWPFHVVRDYAKTLQAGNSRMMPKVPGYVDLAHELEAVQPPLPIIYAHNDMLPANFIDDGEKIWLIDFEYAAYSTAMFDLAGIASNALFEPEQDAGLLWEYFGSKPDAALIRGHAAMKCASLLREAMWSMVSEIHLDAPGVDYEAYTQENLERLDAVLDAYRSRF